ncbi:hypothetical protein F1640_14870 [Novosphingobium sp. NBM11]|uniref:hypothetical protein n=1 Tax=Novosphingobium sp. NBM11 TaxID=2596914 RepID=UPI0018925697|nr:hypothetical protein [Novosphingobium sp. NBM11]MBF5091269.1 hypothetical protein [Novosphingobium sp. NBM11]
MTTSNDDLNRSLGRLEGDVTAMKDRMDRLEKAIVAGMEELKNALREVQADVAEIKAREDQRRGAWRVLVGISTVIGAAVSAAVTYLFGKFG